MPLTGTSDQYSYFASSQNQMPGFGSGMRDWSHSTNRYQAANAWSGPSTLQTGNQLIDITGMIALQSLLGADTLQRIRPMSQVGMPALDYFSSRSRMLDTTLPSGAQGSTLQDRIMNQNTAFLERSMGTGAAQNRVVQQLFDANFMGLNPYGSQYGTFGMLHSGIGRRFGTEGDRAFGAESGLQQINSYFAATDSYNKGGLDMRKSYGYKRDQMAEMLDVSSRYGIGGLSQTALGDSIRGGTLGQTSQGVAKMFSAASEVFGKDKGIEELGRLMSSLEGFKGLDPNKAADVLHKIQATSRAIGISTEAFAEYSGMMSQVYKSVGIGGPVSMDHAMSASVEAASITETSTTKFGTNARLADMGKNLELANINRANAVASPLMNRITAFGSLFSSMSLEQRAGMKIGGMSGVEFKDAINTAMENGDQDRLQQLVRMMPSRVNGVDVGMLSAHLTDEDRIAAGGHLNLSNATGQMAGNLKKRIAGVMAGRGLGVLGGADGIRKMLDEVGGFNNMANRDLMEDYLARNHSNMSAQQRSEIASSIAGVAIELRGDTNWLAASGPQNQDQAEALLQGDSNAAKKQRSADRGNIAADVVRQKLIAGISGGIMNGFDLRGEGAKLVTAFLDDLNTGKISKDTFFDKDGKPVGGEFMKWAKGKYGDSFMEGDMKMLQGMGEAGSAIQTAEEQAKMAYDETFKKTGSAEKARAAQEKSITSSIAKMQESLSFTEKDTPATGGAAKAAEKVATAGSEAVESILGAILEIIAQFPQFIEKLLEVLAGLKDSGSNPGAPPLPAPKTRE